MVPAGLTAVAVFPPDTSQEMPSLGVIFSEDPNFPTTFNFRPDRVTSSKPYYPLRRDSFPSPELGLDPSILHPHPSVTLPQQKRILSSLR